MSRADWVGLSIIVAAFTAGVTLLLSPLWGWS